MQVLRTFFAIVALVAVALLPGPSHALAAAAHAPVPSDAHADHHHRADHRHGMHETMAAATHDHDHGSSRPCGSCKSCALACCAPVTAAVSIPMLAAEMDSLPMRRQRPEADPLRHGPVPRPALRPPAFRSA